MVVGGARLRYRHRVATTAVYTCAAAALFLLFGSRALQNAIAEGDTRTLSLHHIHTGEDITVTFKRDGRYDEAALEKLNWFLRDWRRQEQTRMDPHLIDLIWEVHRETGSNEPIWVVCGYRSPQTNAMLRRRSRGVARFSQHTLGRAMDFYVPGVSLEQLRVIGLRLQRGGVGFYPASGSPFVHMDTGPIRHWPRMTREQLVRIFPDGRTVHIPTDGRPLAGYALALAEIRKRGASPSEMSLAAARNAGIGVADATVIQRITNPVAKLFGLALNDQDEDVPAAMERTAASTMQSPAAEPLRGRTKVAIAAAIDRTEQKLVTEKNKLIQVAARAKDELVAEKNKLVRAVAKPHVISRAEAAPVLTPNEIILTRGFWQGVPEGMSAVKPEPTPPYQFATSLQPAAGKVASAVPEAAGSVEQVTGPIDRVPAEIALAYAEQAENNALSRTAVLAAVAGPARPRANITGPVALQSGDDRVTVAVKRVDGRPASAILTVADQATIPARAGATGPDDPWLRAVLLSPSVNNFLCITALGAYDFRSLAAFMVKPANSVMISFGPDPQPDLASDHFGGSAIVFVSTVTYPLQTAGLQRRL